LPGGSPAVTTTEALDTVVRVSAQPPTSESGLPIKLLHDRVLVKLDANQGERRSSGGIVIPATAQVGRRLAWAEVVGVGQNVRNVETGDRVLFDPQETPEIELHGQTYMMLRERDLHAVAAARVHDGSTGLYL
jgi:chaperonin GroES